MTADVLPNLKNWSITASSNQPDTSDAIGPNKLAENLQTMESVVRYMHDTGTIASAATTDIGTIESESMTVTGTTTITALGTVSAGIRKKLIFNGALTLTHNATSLILPGAANVTTAAGDTCEMLSLGAGNWRCLWYTRAVWFLPLSGGTLTGGLTGTAATFTGGLTGTTATFSSTINVTGAATFGSTVGLNADPTTALQAATKQYVDNNVIGKSNRETVNVGIAVSLAGNAVTIALKGADGADPSTSNLVRIGFRSPTLSSGVVNERTLTAALSTAISSGSTAGTVSGQPSRIWIAAIDATSLGGAVELAWFNSLSGVSIAHINESFLITTTAEGGAGAADNAQTWYSTTARTSVPFTILGYFESTQTTAGTWAQAITEISVNPLLRPNDIVQNITTQTGAVATGTGVIPSDDTIPQNTEGDQYMSVTLTPVSAANILVAGCLAMVHVTSSSSRVTGALFQDVVANALTAITTGALGTGDSAILKIEFRKLSGTLSGTTFKFRAGADSAGTLTFNGASSARLFGGVANSHLSVQEVMT